MICHLKVRLVQHRSTMCFHSPALATSFEKTLDNNQSRKNKDSCYCLFKAQGLEGQGVRVWGWFRVSDIRFRFWFFGVRVPGLALFDTRLGFVVFSSGYRVSGLGMRGWGARFRVSGFKFWISGVKFCDFGCEILDFGCEILRGFGFRAWRFSTHDSSVLWKISGVVTNEKGVILT